MSFGDNRLNNSLGDRLANFKQRLLVGTVTAVDTTAFTLVALVDGGEISQIPWISPLGHPDGTGTHTMYRQGSRVLISEYELGSYVVLGSIGVFDGETVSAKNSRKSLNQGDQYLSVSEQTYILLQRPDFITLSGNFSCKVVFDGTTNIIYARAQRYQVQADGGNMYWSSDPLTNDTVLSCIFRDKAAKDGNVVHMKAGFHKTEDPEAIAARIDKSVFSIIVKKVTLSSEDTYEEEPKFKLIIGENGRILCSAESIKEVYRDFIDRYAETTMTDVAKSTISTESLDSGIYETAKTEIINTAPYINHKGP